MSEKIDITVVVPVYNSVETLRPLYERTVSTLAELGKSYEVLFVEDGGPEESWNALKQIKSDFEPNVTLIRLGRNYGQNAATVCGIVHAKGNTVVTIDDDLQTPPEEIEKLIVFQEESRVDIVFGVTPSQNNPFFKRLGSDMMKKVFKWADGAEIGSSFRLIAPQLKEQLSRKSHDQLFLNQVVHWYTESVGKVPVKHEARQEGSSGYSFLGLFGIAIKLLFFYTDLPLRLMSATGFLIALVCFGFGIYFIYERLVIGTEAGFASIITAIFFATGVIMICMSILGAYISRIYTDRIKKPMYSVKTIL